VIVHSNLIKSQRKERDNEYISVITRCTKKTKANVLDEPRACSLTARMHAMFGKASVLAILFRKASVLAILRRKASVLAILRRRASVLAILRKRASVLAINSSSIFCNACRLKLRCQLAHASCRTKYATVVALRACAATCPFQAWHLIWSACAH